MIFSASVRRWFLIKDVTIEDGERNVVNGDQNIPRNGDVIIYLDFGKRRIMILQFRVM